MTSIAEATSHAVSPDDFLAFDAAIRGAKRERDDAAAEFARAQKAAKDAGIDLKAYKIIAQFRKLDDDEQIVVARHFVQMLAWLDMPLGTQMSMLDAPQVPKPSKAAKQAHSLAEIGEMGLKAGREGDPASNNLYLQGSEEHAIWARKHAEGLAERATAARMQSDDDDDGPVVADNTSIPGGKKRGGRGFGGGRGRVPKHTNGGVSHIL